MILIENWEKITSLFEDFISHIDIDMYVNNNKIFYFLVLFLEKGMKQVMNLKILTLYVMG